MTQASSTKWEEALCLYDVGASDVEVAKVLNITKKVFLNMYESVPAFTSFVDKGRTLSEAWWMTQIRENVGNKDFNTSMLNFNMKNRFGWADRVETTTKDDEGKNTEQLREEFRTLAARLEKSDPSLGRTLVALEGGKGT